MQLTPCECIRYCLGSRMKTDIHCLICCANQHVIGQSLLDVTRAMFAQSARSSSWIQHILTRWEPAGMVEVSRAWHSVAATGGLGTGRSQVAPDWGAQSAIAPSKHTFPAEEGDTCVRRCSKEVILNNDQNPEHTTLRGSRRDRNASQQPWKS